MSAKTVTIHPLNVKPGDVVVTVTSDTEITVTREVSKWRQGQAGTGTLNFYDSKGHPGVRMMRYVAPDGVEGFVTEDGEQFPDGMANHVTDFVPETPKLGPVSRERLDEIVNATFRAGGDTRALVVISVLEDLGFEVQR